MIKPNDLTPSPDKSGEITARLEAVTAGRPITIDISIDSLEFNLEHDDALVIGNAVGQALLTYSRNGGDLNKWSARAEGYELDSGDGLRVYIEGLEQ